MGFRIRKSIKIGKGMRMNVGKTGVGMSFGTRGIHHTVHSSGRRTDSVGIPGTGLYYTKTHTKGAKRRTPASNENVVSANKQKQLEKNQSAVHTYQHYIETITHLHKRPLPEPLDWEAISEQQAPFNIEETGPAENKARNELNHFSPNILERLIKTLANRKKQTLETQIKHAKEIDQKTYEAWQHQHKQAEKALALDSTTLAEILDERAFKDIAEWMAEHQLILNNQGIPELTFAIKTKNTIPKKQLSLTKTGRVSKRNLTKTDYHAIKQDYVTSFALNVSEQIFNLLPIDDAIVHIQEERLNTATGYENKTTILSVAFNRQTLKKLNLDQVNPTDAMQNFNHHMNHLQTKGFKAVKPIMQTT